MVTVVDDVVVKRHSGQTDPRLLASQLSYAATDGAGLLLAPLSVEPVTAPDGRVLTVWPWVEVLSPDDASFPWAEAGALLARLHARPTPPLQPHGGRARLARSIASARALDDAEASGLLAGLALGLLRSWPEEAHGLVHGDFHLGQLGRLPSGRLVLLDLDDLGVGDPAWDLGRPAGFHAAGLLPDADWGAFVSGYRSVRPWPAPTAPALDHAARSSVVLGAILQWHRLEAGDLHSEDTAGALLDVCRRLAESTS